MVDVPLDARAVCSDGPCGQSVGVIIEPLAWQVTHFVVEECRYSRTERVVSAGRVVDTTPDTVRLRCRISELAGMQPFVEIEYAQLHQSTIVGGQDCTWYHGWPYLLPVTTLIPLKSQHTPAGEIAVHRGARVKATDGGLGQLDEFLVDPTTRRITHLVLRQGHLWSQRDVMVPVSEIESAQENMILLRLDKHAVALLPSIPIRRWHDRKAA